MTRGASFVLAVALLATGCESGKGPEAAREIVWATGAIDATTGPARDIADSWNRLHPNGPTVRLEALPQAADDQRQLMAIELKAGLSSLDVLSLDVIWTGEFAVHGWLTDLADIRPDVARASLPGPLQSGTWNGKLWAAPLTSGAGFLYYRTDLVAHPPTTWDELVEVGHRVAAREGIAPLVAQGAQYEGMVVNYLEYLWGTGGDLFSKEGTTVTLDVERARAALDFMAQARSTGVYAPGFPDMKEEDARIAFQSGKAVFMRNWSYAYNLMNGQDPTSKVIGKFDIAPLPTFSGDGTTSGLGGQNLAVNRHSRNVQAAKEFVRFASTSPEVQRRLATDYSATPAMAAVYKDLSGDPVMALLGQILPQARPRPATPEWNEISDELQQQIWPAYNGQRDPEEAVKAIRTFLERTVAQQR